MLYYGWVYKIDHSLVTKTYRVKETGTDDPSVSLNSSYSSFRSSLNLNVDFCSKNLRTLEQKKYIKSELVAEQGEKNRRQKQYVDL